MQQQQKVQTQRSNRITLYSLLLFVIGFCFCSHPIISFVAVVVLLISIKLKIDKHASQKDSMFLQSINQLIKIGATMLLFGIIDYISITNLKEYYSPYSSSSNDFNFHNSRTIQNQQVIVASTKQSSISLINNNSHFQFPLFSTYLLFMTVYYYFQLQLVNNFHHKQLCWKSFLIYHSKQYTIANLISLTEHFVTKYLFDFDYKDYHMFIYPALIGMILGQGLRISAFFTAKNNFTHIIRHRKTQGHQLIKNGVYSIFRHPSYTGYFYFAACSQLFLGNFLSFIGFFIALSNFFNQRIQYEQQTLISFFQDYRQYKKNTYILIPFVKDPQFKGYQSE